MSIESIKGQLGDYAKDTKLNLGRILSETGSELSKPQIYSIALACSYATKNKELIDALEADSQSIISEEAKQAAKSAATIMGMNNIYYRFVHLSEDQGLARMPANLRMNVIANPSVDKVDFELYSLAISAINGCGMCIQAHIKALLKEGIGKDSLLDVARIASVINSVAQALVIEDK